MTCSLRNCCRMQGGVQVPVRRPDGDVELKDAGLHFAVPPCDRCGGILKPDVVFFGDSLPPARSQAAVQMAREADLLLVVGSSLMVFSAFRCVSQLFCIINGRCRLFFYYACQQCVPSI